MITNFKAVAKHYGDLEHQNKALDWLWEQTPSFIKVEFTRLWRLASAEPPEAAPAPAPEAISNGSTNADGLHLIKSFEGFRANAYICPAGVWTVGYGTTRISGRPVNSADKVDEPEADALLRHDLVYFENEVKRLVRVPLTSNQFSAIVSFVYNIGSGAFSSSTFLRLLNSGDYNGAASQFERWVYGGGTALPGLVRRRVAERALFLKP